MAICVEIPTSYSEERRYILSVLFQDFLGVEINVTTGNRTDTKIAFENGKRMIVEDGLFALPVGLWLKPGALPLRPLQVWNVETAPFQLDLWRKKIPVIYGGRPGQRDMMEVSDKELLLHLDVFGSCFFMLTRYEEVVRMDRDQHDRFPAKASLAFKESFLDRPIVNEYLEILWACMKRLCPGLVRRERVFCAHISHDVDNPFLIAFCKPWDLTRKCVGDVLKRGDPVAAIERAYKWLQVKAGNVSVDPYNTFDLIMNISERCNMESEFYFQTEGLSDMDGGYAIGSRVIRKLMNRIHGRGHSVGLHASYNSYCSAEQTRREFGILKSVCEEEGIRPAEWGGRQHYLRWRTPTSFQNLSDAGLDFDTTLCFADYAGFRCGVCYEYPVFNVVSRQRLRLRERPLIVMECTVTNNQYMGLKLEEEAVEEMKRLKEICRQFKGKFTLLWHNHNLVDKKSIGIYEEVLRS
jgi:hypothetical protein